MASIKIPFVVAWEWKRPPEELAGQVHTETAHATNAKSAISEVERALAAEYPDRLNQPRAFVKEVRIIAAYPVHMSNLVAS